MAYTQAQLDEIDAVIHKLTISGVKSTTYQGDTVTYRDLKELREQRGIIASAVADATSGPASRTWFAQQTRKGL